MSMLRPARLICGSSNPALGDKLAAVLGQPITSAAVQRFADGEIGVQINESIRADDVFLVQSTCAPSNDHLMELALLIDACRRASAARINAVLPYFGYSRQDGLTGHPSPISAKVVANMLTAVGVDRIITIDIHAAQIQGFFEVPVDHLHCTRLLVEHLKQLPLDEPVVVSPDAGGVDRATQVAMGLGGSIALIDRGRSASGSARSMQLVGDVQGRDCVLVDDIIDTGGTLTEAAALLVARGARSVRAAVTHPVLSGAAVARLERSQISELITTDTIPLSAEKQSAKISVVTVAPLLAAVIRNVHVGASVLALAL
ncbi:MAG: ribose-phosphate pyrophosphokinase [Proteobacteria bacterium]|nr:ribose-phosphate pyrophosphokinase [Pseudomonadota bacterium]